MLRSSENHGSRMPFVSFRRPIATIGNHQYHSEMSSPSDIQNLDLFHKQLCTRFHNLSVAKPDEFLSISWICKLLDAFTASQEDFKLLLNINKSLLSKPPTDKLATEFFDRSVKAMDIFNATRDGIETIRLWQKHLEIIVCALDSKQKMIGEGQFRRTRKALTDLALVMLDEKDNVSALSVKYRSFGRKSKGSNQPSPRHSRSLSWSVPQTWSACKQLQSIANNLVSPRTNDISTTNGISVLVFSMSFILLFVLWALVAAIPCQDRGVQINFSFPRNFSWSTPLFMIHSRIMNEVKKKDKRSCSGLLREICRIEKCVDKITGLVDATQCPLSDERKEDMRENVSELESVCEICKTGLDSLERQLRDVFRKIMTCRIEGLEFLGKATEP